MASDLDPFYLNTLRQLVREGVMDPTSSLLCVCAGERDHQTLKEAGFPEIPVYGTVEAEPSPVFSSAGKGAFAAALAPFASWSVAIGDSEIETDMMHNCEHAVVVTRRCKKSQELNPRLIQAVRNHPLLWCTSHDDQRHSDLPFSAWEDLFTHLETKHHQRHAA